MLDDWAELKPLLAGREFKVQGLKQPKVPSNSAQAQ